MPKDLVPIINIPGGGKLVDVGEVRKAVKLLNDLSIPITVKELLDVIMGKTEFVLKTNT